MRKNIMRFTILGFLAGVLLLSLTTCSLDVTNPNNASVEQVLTTSEGIKTLAVGLQQYYANNALSGIILYQGVTARELAINTTYYNLEQLEDGGTALVGAGNVLGIWSMLLRVMSMSEQLIENASAVPLAPGTESGILAMAHLFDAMAIGYFAQIFEQVPLQTNPDENASFHSREEAMTAVLDHIDTALGLIAATPTSDEFNNSILGPEFDLENTLKAYKARYLLISGDYAAAATAANVVDPNATSFFSYDTKNQNPIYSAVEEQNYYRPRDGLGTPVIEAGDARLDFFVIPDSAFSNPKGYAIEKLAGFFTNASSSIPAYYPSEMTLIKAEAALRQGDVGTAISYIDQIRTKVAADDLLGIGAGLAAYSGAQTESAIEEEIYRQRSAELYLTGMRFEDSRRLHRPGPPDNLDERNRNFYPYPDQERLNNPNTPDDPAI